jgi:hypothetical protein
MRFGRKRLALWKEGIWGSNVCISEYLLRLRGWTIPLTLALVCYSIWRSGILGFPAMPPDRVPDLTRPA